MLGEIVDERAIISASTECGCMCWYPNVRVDYVQDPFAYIPLCREWMSALFAELTRFTYTNALSFFKFGSPMTTPFDCMFWSYWRLMGPILLCHSFKSVDIANMADLTLFDSRMNIRPSLRLRAMIRPFFSMKQPPSWN